MKEKYIVYKYIPNRKHDSDYKQLLQRYDLSKSNKLFFKNYKMLIKWLYHMVFTVGKVRIFSLYNDKTLVHYSFVTSYCYKFGFMNKSDFVIGPCWTADRFRGNRIYPITISKIAFELIKKDKGTNVFLLIRPKNKESTNAISHSNGWIPVGTISKTKFKNYRKCKWDEGML